MTHISSRFRTARRAARRVSVFAAMLLAACATESPVQPDPSATDSLTALPRALSTAEVQAVSASNGFAVALFRQVLSASPAENVVLSPFSASVALGMTMHGAAGGTRAAMRSTLGWSAAAGDADVAGAYRDMQALLPTLDSSVTMTSANAIWYRQGFPVEASYLQATRDFFKAAVTGADFAAPATLAAINSWASTTTKGRIPKVLDTIEPQQVMFLLNALYFKGAWRTRFNTADTYTGTFRQGNGQSASVPFMSRTGGSGVRFAATNRYSALELPYGNGAFVMDLFVPATGVTLADLTSDLAGAGWQQAVNAMAPAPSVRIALPRFRVTTTAQLKTPLSALGMGVAFAPGAADFTGISSARGRDLYLDFVKQDAMIEVTEAGTTAAAVTTIGVGVTSAGPEFRADRPFLFAIRERFSNTLLFLGAVQQVSAF
ncbi:serpin family protein [Gemmatimonas sp.]|jgi:serpin B|uniref:serpin family protein n=1 Tax=Gemmatimonas sp. TaxID=1962908 RepID=UPI0037BFA12C